MPNRILINAVHMQEELRVAVVNQGVLTHLDIEAIAKQQTKAFVYKGKVTRIEPSLEACFVDYGETRHGFLPLKDISPAYFTKQVGENDRPSIKDVLKEGQELIVQVEKIERGNKGAALTTYITLAGSYLVLMPNSPRAGGVSRRIEGDERNELNDILKQLVKPDDVGIIIRTASVGKSLDELQWDLDILLKLWESINNIANQNSAPILIHQESNAIIRALRDYLRQDIDEIIIDQPDVYEEAKKYIQLIRPDFVEKVKFFDEKTPLFSHFNVESQVESVFKRELRLPSGGSLSIDQTEALIAIDINSSRATKGSDIEETALHTNLEAANEIARQLRLRDCGGLIVIDFIDMMQSRNQRQVEDQLREALKADRAKVQLGRISRFGLMEMSRQRLRATFGESTKIICTHCKGQGTMRSVPSHSLSILRAIETSALRDNTYQVRAHLPVEIATYLLNEKRQAISNIETSTNVNVVLIPHSHLSTHDYEIENVKHGKEATDDQSYKLAMEFKQNTNQAPDFVLNEPTSSQQPALKSIEIPDKPKAGRSSTNKPGIFVSLWRMLFGNPEPKKTKRRHYNKRSNSRRHHANSRGGNRGNAKRGNNQRNQRHSGGNRRHNNNNRGNQQQRARHDGNNSQSKGKEAANS